MSIVGAIAKTPGETHVRYTVDCSQWLDNSETLSAISAPTVVLTADPWPGPWPNSVPPPVPPSTPILPPDPTPLTVDGSYITSSGLFLTVYVSAGSDGNAYAVTHFLTGSSSGRVRECRVDVRVNQSAVMILS